MKDLFIREKSFDVVRWINYLIDYPLLFNYQLVQISNNQRIDNRLILVFESKVINRLINFFTIIENFARPNH